MIQGDIGEHLPPQGMAISGISFALQIRTAIEDCHLQRFPGGRVDPVFCNLTGQRAAGLAGAHNSEIVWLVCHESSPFWKLIRLSPPMLILQSFKGNGELIAPLGFPEFDDLSRGSETYRISPNLNLENKGK